MLLVVLAVFAIAVLTIAIITRFERGVALIMLLVTFQAHSFGIAITSSWNYHAGDKYAAVMPLHLYITLITLIGFFMVKFSKARTFSLKDPMLAPVVFLLCYAAFTLSWSGNIGHSLFEFMILVTNVAVYTVVLHSISDEKRHRKAVWMWIGVMLVMAFITLLLFFVDNNMLAFERKITDTFTLWSKIASGPFQSTGHIRRGSAITSAHMTGLYMNLTFALTFGLLLSETRRFYKVVLFGILYLCMFITIITNTRGSLIALIAMFFFFLYFSKEMRKRLFLVLLSFFILLAGTVLLQKWALNSLFVRGELPTRIIRQLTESSGKKVEDLSPARAILWSQGLERLRRSSYAGDGIGGFKYHALAPYAHSIYFSFLFDFGIVGIVVFAIMLIILSLQFIPFITPQSTYIQNMCLAAFGGLFNLAVHGLVDFEYNEPIVWLFVGLAVASLNIAKLKKGENSQNPARSDYVETKQPSTISRGV